MKSLNRTLSLVLVLAMCLGLMGIASAATFTDNTTVQYTEAVSVMTGIGAINGYADGTFKPTATITREEAAKMICYAVLGPTTASKLSVASTGFTDVAASRWSSPFIAYCVGQGIINGLGDGTFAPTANVTGYALAKMMLAAAGYGKKGEFTGASWELNVAVMANRYGVFTGAKTADFSKAATREEAALYVFNALTLTPMVTYSKLTEEYTPVVNKATTEITNDDAYEIAESTYTKLLCDTSPVNGVAGHTWYLDGTAISDFISDATVLGTIKDGTKISSATDNTNSAYIASRATDADLTTAAIDPITYFYNGKSVDAFSNATIYAVGDLAVKDNLLYKIAFAGTITTFNTGTGVASATANNAAEYSVRGALVTLNAGTGANAKKVISVGVIKKTVEQLAVAPTTTTTGIVTKVTVGAIPESVSTAITYPAGLVKGDVILWYVAGGHYYVEKAASVTGTVASFTTDYATIDSTKYYPSGLGSVAIGNLSALLSKTGYTFYLDNGGNVVFLASPTNVASVTNTLFVTAVQGISSFGATTYQAAVVKPDGTQDVITVKKTAGPATVYVGTVATAPALTAVTGTANPDGSGTPLTGNTQADGLGTIMFANGNLVKGAFYTYATNSDGSYNLTVPATQSKYLAVVADKVAPIVFASGDTSYVVKAGAAQFIGSESYTAAWSIPSFTSSPVATSSTIFLYYDDTAKTFSVKTGIANALSYKEGGNICVLKDSTGTYAQVVVCTGASSAVSTSNLDQILVTSGETTSADTSGTPTHIYTAIVNGVKDKTVTSYVPLVQGNLYFTKDYATNGNINSYDTTTGVTPITSLFTTTTTDTAVAYAGGTLSVKTSVPVTTSYILSSTVAIFLVNNTSGTPAVSQITADGAAAQSYDGTADHIYLIPTSSTDSTIAAIYIYID